MGNTGQSQTWESGDFLDIWMRTLHKHYADGKRWYEYGFEVPPHLEAKNRQGSNCAAATLDQNYVFYVEEWGVDFEAETNHSRNGDGVSGFDNIAQMAFDHMMRRPDWWHHAGIDYTGWAYEMSQADKDKILSYSHQAALDMMDYGDWRIEGNWDNIAQMRIQHPETTFFSGMELNLLSDGTVDTELHSDPRCQLTVLSLHPDVDQGFKDREFNRDPSKHSIFMAKALVDHSYANIWAHPGFHCQPHHHTEANGDGETAFRRQMDWQLLAPILLKKDMALEINWSRVYQWACRKLHQLDNAEWLDQAKDLFEQAPFLNDPETMDQLREYISMGGLIAINNDGHYVPPTEGRDRFLQLLFAYGAWMDRKLQEYNIKPNQVVNTWPVDGIRHWLGIA